MIETGSMRRPSFIDRQNRERSALISMYDFMEVGLEYKFMSTEKMAAYIKVKVPFLDEAVRIFESLSIITRRLEYNALLDDGTTSFGRSYHWKFLVPKDKALLILDAHHKAARALPPRTSMKFRILEALSSCANNKFNTTEDLAKVIRRPNENLDLHNLTHVMESLAKEGKIDFERGKTKDRIPFNIRLSKNMTTVGRGLKATAFTQASDIIENSKPEISTLSSSEEYPLILRLIKRKELLEMAARLAEDAEEDDVAITLLDRANKPLTPFEMEAINLYESLMKMRA